MKCCILFCLIVSASFCHAQDSVIIHGRVYPEIILHPLQKIRNAEIVVSNSYNSEIKRIKTDTNGCFSFSFLPEINDSIYLISIFARKEKQYVIDSFCRLNVTRTPDGYLDKYLRKNIKELNDSLIVSMYGPLICHFASPVIFKENSVKLDVSLFCTEQLYCISNSYKKLNVKYPERIKIKISYSSSSRELDALRVELILKILRNLLGMEFNYISDEFSDMEKNEIRVNCIFD